MDGIIKSTDNRYSEYETLLFLRDKLRKEAYAWKNRYLAEFGNLITAVFEQKSLHQKEKDHIFLPDGRQSWKTGGSGGTAEPSVTGNERVQSKTF